MVSESSEYLPQTRRLRRTTIRRTSTRANSTWRSRSEPPLVRERPTNASADGKRRSSAAHWRRRRRGCSVSALLETASEGRSVPVETACMATPQRDGRVRPHGMGPDEDPRPVARSSLIAQRSTSQATWARWAGYAIDGLWHGWSEAGVAGYFDGAHLSQWPKSAACPASGRNAPTVLFLRAPEPWFEDFGRARLRNGRSRIPEA
jgi:hypothetical protein